MAIRIAFCGASGTGKSTLAEYVSQKYHLTMNPVGSRSVARAMGFESPYDVDKAGKRGEFQRRLLHEKVEWEDGHENFVTDRTTVDNLVYALLHDVHSITEEDLVYYKRGVRRYTHVIHCPTRAFCKPGDDPVRVTDMTYHHLYDLILSGIIYRWISAPNWEFLSPDLDARKKSLDSILRGRI